MHFKDDPISDKHIKIVNYIMSEAFVWALKIWSRLLAPSFSGAVPSNTTILPQQDLSLRTWHYFLCHVIVISLA